MKKTYKITIKLNPWGKNLLKRSNYLVFKSCEDPETLAKELIPEQLISEIEVTEINCSFKVGDVVRITYEDGGTITTQITDINFYPDPKNKDILVERISVRDSQQDFRFSGLPTSTGNSILEIESDQGIIEAYKNTQEKKRLVEEIEELLSGGLDWYSFDLYGISIEKLMNLLTCLKEIKEG